MRITPGLIAPLALLLVSASADLNPAELIRAANAAFDRVEYDEALQLYEQAEARCNDPGLPAFNEGAVLYRTNRMRDAELHFRQALDGASGLRQARALYNVGTCLIRVAGEIDPRGLSEALSCLEECLIHPDADPDLKVHAAHNLELARLLWQRARRAAKESPSSKDLETGGSPTNDRQARSPGGNLDGQEGGRKGRPNRPERADGRKATETGQETPGKGNLRPLSDRDELVPLTPEEAAAHLARAAERILREQRDYRQSSASNSSNGKDW